MPDLRISPFEAWRVERTKQRVAGKVPGQPRAARGGASPRLAVPLSTPPICFPPIIEIAPSFANRPITWCIATGWNRTAPSRAVRAHADCEFLASTDIWFRPVNLSVGPDGTLYVVDFYREAIETPLSLPAEIKKMMNLESRGRGRIWRISPGGGQTVAKLAPGAKSQPMNWCNSWRAAILGGI